jgi:hypothetical protein
LKTLKAVKSSKSSAVTGTNVVAKDGAKRTGAVKQSVGDEGEMEPPRKRAKKTHDSLTPVVPPFAAEVDAEMKDHDSAAGSQDGYNADEVGIANTLLEMAAGSPEVHETATILMDMRKGGAHRDGQPGQSGEAAGGVKDSEVNDA